MHGLLCFSARNVDELRAIVKDIRPFNDSSLAKDTEVAFFVSPDLLNDTRIGSTIRTNLVGFKAVAFHDRAKLKQFSLGDSAPAAAELEPLPVSA